MKAICQFLITEDEKYNVEIFEKEKELLNFEKPNIWNAHVEGNMELKMEADYERFLFSVAEHSNEKIDELTVWTFYSLKNYLIEKHSDG